MGTFIGGNYAVVTQLGECKTEDLEVAGSSPAHGTISSEPDRVFIDIRTCDLTLSQVMNEIAKLQSEYPEYEIFMDGDSYAIVGRRRNQR